MADNLSPLVNLDLVNQIYRTINAQISERVYDPNYYSAAELGDANHRYVNAYLKALNVSGDVTVGGKVTSTGGFDGSLITVGSDNYIRFKRYQTANSPTSTSATYTLENSLSNSETKIPTSKAVYSIIGDLETLLANI